VPNYSWAGTLMWVEGKWISGQWRGSDVPGKYPPKATNRLT
jgi:hypothetical protein